MPIDIKHILNETGYDNEVSLSDISEKNIEEIEIYVNKNRQLLENTIYKNIVPFEFRPGHRSLILNLPKNVQGYIESKKTNKINKKVVKEVQTQKNEAELKTELLKKLMNYAKTRKYEIQINSESITQFIKAEDTARCRVKCVFCSLSIVCTYKSFWAISNYETHFRNHIKDIEEKKKASAQESQNKENRNQNSTIDTANNTELRKILELENN